MTVDKCHHLASTEGPLIRADAWLILCRLKEWTCSQGAAPDEEGRDKQLQNSEREQTRREKGQVNSDMKRRREQRIPTVKYSGMQCNRVDSGKTDKRKLTQPLPTPAIAQQCQTVNICKICKRSQTFFQEQIHFAIITENMKNIAQKNTSILI